MKVVAVADDDREAGFEAHLKALDKVLTRAASVTLRFKLSKACFCQYKLPTLGLIAGLGTVDVDPKKVAAITLWPRPSRQEDIENSWPPRFSSDPISPPGILR